MFHFSKNNLARPWSQFLKFLWPQIFLIKWDFWYIFAHRVSTTFLSFLYGTKLFYLCLTLVGLGFAPIPDLIRVEEVETPNWDDWLRVEMIGNYLHWRLLFCRKKYWEAKKTSETRAIHYTIFLHYYKISGKFSLGRWR